MKRTILAMLLVMTWGCGHSSQAQAVPILANNSGSADFGQQRDFKLLWHSAKPIKGKKTPPTQLSTCVASPTIQSPRSPHTPHRFGFGKKLGHNHPAGHPPVYCPTSEGNVGDGNG